MHFGVRLGKLTLRWTGRSDVNWNRSYGADLPLSISCALDFKGISCGRLPEAAARLLVSPFIDDRLLEFSRTEHGVSLLRPRS
jgi:hypothetical protein